jgi:peptidoglycan hydrolase-like protein with peptidoglycan-binding domain
MKIKAIITAFGILAIASVANAQYGGGGGGGVIFVPGASNDPNLTRPVGLVLGASTTASTCGSYIVRYGKPGADHSDVVKLKKFLNKYENANLGETSSYNTATFAAVKAYQAKYGVNPKSGLQLVKTTKKINDQYCGYVAQGK